MSRRRRALALVSLAPWLFAARISAVSPEAIGPGTVVVRLEREAGGAGAPATPGRLTATSTSDRESAPTSRDVEVPGAVSLDLAPGVWRLALDAPGLWAADAVVTVASGGSQVVLPVLPTAPLHGRVETPRGLPLPAEIEVRFSPPPARPRSSPRARKERARPEGSLTCPVPADGRWRCELPAGTHDLRLHARGFAAVYRWGLEVAPRSPLDLGRLPLVPGASVVGFVERADGAPLDRSAVELRPLHAGHLSRDQDESFRSMSLMARPNDRGFFQLGDVAPGTYALAVTAAGLAPLHVQPVEVLEGLETRLPHPFRLEPPAALEVEVVPAAGPGGARWTIRLARQVTRGVLRDVDEATLGEDGRRRFEGLAPGLYRVDVVDGSGSRWITRTVDVAPVMAPIVLEIPLVEVEGALRGVEEPADVSIWFGGLHGSPRVGFVTDEEGLFSGTLPREGTWPVDLILRRGDPAPLSLEPVEVRRTPGQPVARVELAVPDTRLSGRVVDEEGREVAGARVSAHGGAAGRQRTVADRRGAFAFVGLAAGRYWAVAETDGAVSESVLVEVFEDQELPELRLVVREQVEVSGLVVSPRGPVPGAAVDVAPGLQVTGGSGVGTVHRITTDLVGRFQARVAPWMTPVTLLVLAPGSAARILSVPASPGRPIEVAVEPMGGRLVLDLSRLPELSAGAGGERLFPMLAHGGGTVALAQLRRWADLHGVAVDEEGTWSLPMMEPGDYALCVALPGSPAEARLRPLCASGTLPLGGELHLSLPQG